MRFNADKCFVLKITHAHKHVFKPSYKLGVQYYKKQILIHTLEWK